MKEDREAFSMRRMGELRCSKGRRKGGRERRKGGKKEKGID